MSPGTVRVLGPAFTSPGRRGVPPAPNRVGEEPPPKTAPMSAPFPVCRRMMRMRASDTTMCRMTIRIYIARTSPPLSGLHDFRERGGGKARTADEGAVGGFHAHQEGDVLGLDRPPVEDPDP